MRQAWRMCQLARHSLEILETIRQYDTFLESIKHVADLGCGTGEDIAWWATLENYNDPPEPYNFNCFAVDNDGSKLAQVPNLPNIHKFNEDFSKEILFPVSIDLMWAHDSLQYSLNPLATLRNWSNQMTVNGMLLLTVPTHTGIEYDKYYSKSYNGCYYHFSPVSLIYMLAVNGFDCCDAYLLKKFNEPWIQLAVYKSEVGPMDPATTTWYDLIDKNLLHPTIVSSINSNGYLKQEEICMPWLNKELYFVDFVSQWEPLPGAPEVPETQGIVNQTTESTATTIQQATTTTKSTELFKPVKIKSKSPTKKSYRND